MKIRTKISIVTVSIIFAVTLFSVVTAVVEIRKKGEADFERYKKEEIAKTKRNLKNLVDIAYHTIEKNYNNCADKKYLERFYGKRLKDIIDIAVSILSENERLVQEGKLSIEEAKENACLTIRKIKYEEDSGYIWINDAGSPFPKMIMHPAIPDIEGKILDNPGYDCAFGKKENLFKAMVDVCLKNGEGFVDYNWPKPQKDGSMISSVPKLSYVKLFKPWGWIIGTGIYIDDAVEDAKEITKSEIRTMRYDNGEGYFWINNTEKPEPIILVHPAMPDIEGRSLNGQEFNCALGKNVNLFRAFVMACENEGAGYVDYNWHKPMPDGSIKYYVPKLSYVKLFKPWGWIIGTGVYVDGIDAKIAEEQALIKKHVAVLTEKVIFVSFLVCVAAVLISIIFSGTITASLRKLIGIMQKIKTDSLSDVKVTLKGSDEIQELGTIFNNMIDSINDGIVKLRDTTAEKQKIESELNIAREIQLSIIPKFFPAFPDRPEFDIYACLKSAKAVGGDLYDFFLVSEDKICFVIGDVSGKGVPASLFMAVTRTLLRAKADAGKSAGEIASAINRDLYTGNSTSMFVTFILCILDIKTGELEYCNAGHNPPFMIRNETKLEKLEKLHGMPLGVSDSEQYSSDKIVLHPRDTIVLYTDGVTEATDPQREMLGDEKLEKLLNENKMLSPKGFTDKILEEVAKFAKGAEQSDDITILVFTYRGNIQK